MELSYRKGGSDWMPGKKSSLTMEWLSQGRRRVPLRVEGEAGQPSGRNAAIWIQQVELDDLRSPFQLRFYNHFGPS